ncbi:hypothetical protein AgCh_035137 [Apium graveolens]
MNELIEEIPANENPVKVNDINIFQTVMDLVVRIWKSGNQRTWVVESSYLVPLIVDRKAVYSIMVAFRRCLCQLSKIVNESLTHNSHKHVEVQNLIPIQATIDISINHLKYESNLRSPEAAKPVGRSPVQSPVSASSGKPVVESLQSKIPVSKVSGYVSHRNSQAVSNKNMIVTPTCIDHSSI